MEIWLLVGALAGAASVGVQRGIQNDRDFHARAELDELLFRLSGEQIADSLEQRVAQRCRSTEAYDLKHSFGCASLSSLAYSACAPILNYLNGSDDAIFSNAGISFAASYLATACAIKTARALHRRKRLRTPLSAQQVDGLRAKMEKAKEKAVDVNAHDKEVASSILDLAESCQVSFAESSRLNENAVFYRDIPVFRRYMAVAVHARRFFKAEDEGLLVYSVNPETVYPRGRGYIFHDHRLYQMDLRPEIPDDLVKGGNPISLAYSVKPLEWDGTLRAFMEYLAQPRDNMMVYFVKSNGSATLENKAQMVMAEFARKLTLFLDTEIARRQGMLS